MLDWHEELIKLRRLEYIEEHGESPEANYKKLSLDDENQMGDGIAILASYFIEEREDEDDV
jgi:hypothetical protein